MTPNKLEQDKQAERLKNQQRLINMYKNLKVVTIEGCKLNDQVVTCTFKG